MPSSNNFQYLILAQETGHPVILTVPRPPTRVRRHNLFTVALEPSLRVWMGGRAKLWDIHEIHSYR